ncbi:hypothetical protein [Ruegeria sp. HKCCA4633]|uniref:hypothetical protein n=2 Tax=Ruegeria TaxID=97050 RepID=UPI0014880762|nr:hypothetical protein [Ruegeria sp. HKCCA4633]
MSTLKQSFTQTKRAAMQLTTALSAQRSFMHYAAKDCFEPMTAIAISRCARSQHENRRVRIILSAAARRENQPFTLSAARPNTSMSKSRDFAAIVALDSNGSLM